MSDDTPNPVERAFHLSLLALGTVVALNIAIGYLRPVLPWLTGGLVVGLVTWVVIALIRWRRSKW